jgi:hypothetical protein
VQSIEEQIADIEKLDRLRRRARTLQQQGLDALSAKPYLPQPRKAGRRRAWKTNPDIKREGWAAPGDDVEKAMMLQGFLLLGAKHEASRRKIRDDLLEITKADCWKTENESPSDTLDNVPIMRCAMVLQALVSVGCALKPAALACFARIALELAEVAAPSWSVGGARASKEAMASAFMTGECARALLAFRKAMLRTGEAAQLIEKEKKEIAALPSEVDVWREQELARRAMALYASLKALRPHLAVKLPDRLLEDLHGLGEKTPSGDIATRFGSLLDELSEAFAVALVDVPSAATLLPPRPARSAETDPAVRILTDKMATAAYNAAEDIVRGLVDALRNNRPLRRNEVRVQRNLKNADRIVAGLLDPTVRFADSKVEYELAKPRLGLTVDGAELIFAGCLLGLNAGWGRPKIRSVFEVARQLLTADGRLQSLQPFNVQSRGYRLNVATLEVTRRLSELATHVEIDLEPGFVEMLMQPFEDTRAPGQDDKDRGWMPDPRGRAAQSVWWVTALAVDALDKVTEMLDAQINRQVLQQFHVRAPDEIELDLSQLFYPDYGLSGLRSDRAGWSKSVAIKLQQLRIHAGRGPQEQEPRYSLILYGPPGTGKTTLVEAAAKSAGVPLVEITPSDILVGGEEAIERRTRHVFLALSMLTNVVILFDEFDPILQNRAKRRGDEPAKSIFEFLTPGMLPKLKRLHDSAKRNRVGYVLATNFVYNLDPAATRKGRFDDQHGIYPPDVISRLGRLLDQVPRQQTPPLRLSNVAGRGRILQAVEQTGGGPMDKIARPGWYTAKNFSEGFPDKTLFYFLEAAGRSMDHIRPEAEFRKQWPEFAAQRTQAADRDIRDIRALMAESDQEKWYWDDWSAIHHWDRDFAQAIGTPGARLDSIGALLSEWVRTRRAVDAPPPTAPGTL